MLRKSWKNLTWEQHQLSSLENFGIHLSVVRPCLLASFFSQRSCQWVHTHCRVL